MKPSGLKSFFKSSKERNDEDFPKNTSTSMLRASSSSSFSSLRSKLETNGFGKKVDSLGSGISGKVDLYYKKPTKEYFAVKTFYAKESYESKEEYRSRCFKEYEIVFNISDTHVNIIKAHKFTSGLSSNQIVFEFAPFNLLKVLQNIKPNENQIFCFYRQVCEGVQFLHSNFIAHRDLKMENLMLDEFGTIKIIDFGAAFFFGPQRLEASGIVGTEALVSPEAFKQLKYYSDANDVWALGILLYNMLNMRFPWKAARESDKEFKQFLAEKDSLKGDYPEEYWDAISGSLVTDPSERIKIDVLVENVSKLAGPHLDCSKLHESTLRSCARRFKVRPHEY
jgi:serine/threonine protein kinase